MRAKTGRRFEGLAYVLVIITMNVIYLCAAFVSQHHAWGFNQLRHMGAVAAVGCYLLLAGLIFLPMREAASQRVWKKPTLPTSGLGHTLFCLAIAGALALVFYCFRNEFVNPDGQRFGFLFGRDVPLKGAHVTHDEMWELFLHSRFWYHTNALFGWSVEYSYQIASVLAGGVFVFVLMRFVARLVPDHSWKMFAGVLSGGFMQLFFGDVENYTLVSVLILVYLYCGYLFLQGKLSVVGPSVALSVAICFHLLAGWLIPSLFYLFWVANRESKRTQTCIAVASAVTVVVGTVAFFDSTMLPISSLFQHSQVLGQGGDIMGMLVKPSIRYYWQLFNLLFLMFPSVAMFCPLLFFRRIELSRFNLFLAISSVSMLVYMFVWEAKLGVYNDWNLFAPCAIPLAFLFWYNFTRIENLRHGRQIYLGVLLTAVLHSSSWIISNHFTWTY